MRIALLYHPWNLSFRGHWTWDNLYDDPRGMSGSELAFVEIGRELARMGHSVHLFTYSERFVHPLGEGTAVHPWFEQPWSEPKPDLAIAINHPGGLENFDCPRICYQLVNSFEYLNAEEMAIPTHWVSPSEPHRRMILEHDHELNQGGVPQIYVPQETDWSTAPLGCDPELYAGIDKVAGRVIYASSPDRGLHHLLYCWPDIKHAVPHAELRIFYRLQEWIEQTKAAQPWAETEHLIEPLKQRAYYIEHALDRLVGDKWGVSVHGAVSRNRIVREMGEAETLAYPVDTVRWSEGFSCTTLEACAAGTVPVIWDTDALGEIYRGAAEVVPRGDLDHFTGAVVRALKGMASSQQLMGERGREFAKEHTWKHTTEKLLSVANGLMAKAGSSKSPTASATSVESSTTS